MRGWLFCVLLTAISTMVAGATDRVALVIGNNAYELMRPLANAQNDAELIHETLTDMGFDAGSEPLLDLDQAGMLRALGQFRARVAQARPRVAIVYYAGHGMELGGSNYLIPKDAEVATDADARFEAIGLDLVIETMGGASELGLVLLDACREDPFANRNRSATRGVDCPHGVVRLNC